jgi:hypothetical protein
MRLTLRTLLAYLDGQLNPQDAELLGQKIEKSDFALRLQRRIQMLATRRNLPAPKVEARGIGDANKVAEYLDGTMPADQVADFERACLESDIQLGEVSACHQILITLGQAVEIDPELRQRIYRLDKFPIVDAYHDSPHAHSEIAEQFVDSAEEQIVYGRGDVFELTPPADYKSKHAGTHDEDIDEPTADDKFASPAKGRLRVLPILASVTSLLLLVLLIVWSTDDWRKGRLRKNNDTLPKVVSPLKNPVDDRQKNESSAKSFVEPRAVIEAETSVNSQQPDMQNVNSFDPALLIDSSKVKPQDADKSVVPPNDRGKPIAETPSFPPLEPAPVNEPKVAQQIENSSLTKLFGVQLTPLGDEVAQLNAGDTPVGLLDKTGTAWIASQEESPLLANQNLMSLPFTRAQIDFAHIKVTLCDATLCELMPTNVQGAPGLRISSGRLVFATRGEKLNDIRIEVDQLRGTLTLQDANAVVAIEVERALPAGADPESIDPLARETRLTIIGVTGHAVWTAQDQVIQLQENISKSYTGVSSGEVQRVDDLPKWISDFDMNFTPEDRVALNGMLPRGADMRAQLADAVASKSAAERAELQVWLELSLLQLGDVSQLSRLLDSTDPAHTRLPVWRRAIQLARQMIARSTLSATEFKTLLQRTDADAGSIFRLLAGFDNSQLEAGFDKQLVSLLNHERLLMRVLAHQSLWEIVGSSLLYRPETPARIREKHFKVWEQKLLAGSIRR